SVLDAVIAALAERGCTLLVLDNLEQLLPGALPTLQSLLERLPRLRCVVTSRRRLVLQGEHTVVLRPLPVPPPTAGPDQLLTFASIRLFLDRARAAAPGFRLTEANAPLIAQLCTRLDGLPLALSIAGGWAHVLSPSQMITESMRRLSELKSRHRDAPERHRSLAAAISTSLDLLPSAVQRLFRRLGVFRGGFTLEAAEAVCDEALVLDGVAELIDASLLEAPPAQGGEIRFRMLDTVRSFAVEQLDPTEHAALRERLLAFLRGRIAAGDKLDAADKRAAWIDSLVPELGNLRQVLGWLIETRPEEGLGLTSALFPLWRMRALAEGRRWLGRALASASARSQPRCRTLREAASLAIHQGNLNEARELFQEAASIARDLGDLASLASVLGGLGLAAENLGDPGEARARYEESLALHRQVHGDRIATAAQANLARLLETEDELDAAQVHAEESYRLFSAQGSWRGAVAAQSNLGRIFHRRGEFEQAMTCYQSALERVRKVGDEVFLVDGLLLLASLLSDTAQFDAARAHLAEAQELSERLGFQTTRAEGLVLEGEIAWREGDHRRAVECARRGLALSPNPRHAEHGLLIIAGASRALGDGPANEARVHYQDLVGRAHERSPARPTSLVAACLEGLAGLLSNDRPGDAAVALGAATAIRASLGTPLAPADLPLLKADSAKLRGELGEPGYLAALQCGRELSASELWDRFLSPQR
ncbi:MAG: ATP-binding protein, partial [Planctomycetota bacterium]